MSSRESGEKRTRALIVEDNEVNRMVAGQMLRRGEIESETAASGRAALEILQEQAFDVVLMDVQMPGMDGLETAREIRRGAAGDEIRNVPIIAMTAYASQEDEDACYAAGMDSYLTKPLNMQLFIDTVKQIVRPGEV